MTDSKPRRPKLITSRDNALLCRARLIRDGNDREAIFIEGLRLCAEALRSKLEIEAVIYSEEIAGKERAQTVIHQLERVAGTAASISEKLLASISYTRTPQGIVCLAKRPQVSPDRFKKLQGGMPLVVILHGINNPVNVGAIVRTAEAAGATGVICTAGTADPYSPKSLRGAMGSAFRLPLWTGAEYNATVDWCRAQRLQIVCADAQASSTYREVDWRRPTALVMGPESTGLTPQEIAATDSCVRIPMKGDTESLNVAVAAGILLYEAHRQR